MTFATCRSFFFFLVNRFYVSDQPPLREEEEEEEFETNKAEIAKLTAKTKALQ